MEIKAEKRRIVLDYKNHSDQKIIVKADPDRIRQVQAKLQFHNPKRLKPERTSVTAMPNKASLQLLLSAKAFYRIFVSFSFPFFSAYAVNTHLRAIYSPFEIVHIASLPSLDLRITEPCRRLCD